MYYDLVASLPYLKHFASVGRSPITRLKLTQRLNQLRPYHAEQLRRIRPLVAWRPERMIGFDESVIKETKAALADQSVERSLREYLALRVDQKILLAAARSKLAGKELPGAASSWDINSRLPFIRRNWLQADFGLSRVYPWFPNALQLLETNDARGLERLLMEIAWRWLTTSAERDMFAFSAVCSYVFRWDIQQAWLVCDSATAKTRFSELINKVTRDELN